MVDVAPVWFNTDWVMDDFFGRFFSGINAKAKSLGYNVILDTAYNTDDLMHIMDSGKIDGAIIQFINQAQPFGTLETNTRFVLLNAISDHPDVCSIMPDNASGIFQMIHRLAELGHKDIGFFALISYKNEGALNYNERFSAYLEAMDRKGLTVRKEFICDFIEQKPDYSDETDRVQDAVSYYMNLPEKPTAIISCHDKNIFIFMQCANSRGWTVPDQLSVVGFDNSGYCLNGFPPLSSIDMPMERMGTTAVECLQNIISDPTTPAIKLRMSCSFIERGSVGPAPVKAK